MVPRRFCYLVFLLAIAASVNFLMINWNIHENGVPHGFAANTSTTSHLEQRFEFLTDPSDGCQHLSDLLVLAAVVSAPGNVDRRMLVRSTWGDVKIFGKTKVWTLFFVGRTFDRRADEEIMRENDLHGDLVVQNYKDSYENLTYKTLSVIEWTSRNCRQAKFILKIDDDVICNVFRLSSSIKRALLKNREKYINRLICMEQKNPKVIRSGSSDQKWAVTTEEYNMTNYPSHCSGMAYLIGRNLVQPLFVASRSVPFFKWEDVYATGMLRDEIGARIEDIRPVYSVSESVSGMRRDLALSRRIIFFLTDSLVDDESKMFWKIVLKRFHRKKNELSLQITNISKHSLN